MFARLFTTTDLHRITTLLTMFGALFLTSGCKDLQPALETVNDLSRAYQSPSQQETSQAIKLALDNGLEAAVKSLGKPSGFSQSAYRIPLPDNIERIADDARRVGLGRYVDDFENSMNSAAEKAVPEALSVFKASVKQMTLNDVVSIMRGGNDAATQYFKRSASSQLKQRFQPIVKNATGKVGVTKQYKSLTQKLDAYSALLGTQYQGTVDIDEYITNKAVEALFDKVALVEQKIRSNPLEQTSQLIRKVFSYYQS